jgi:hypothetical protein
MLGCGTDLRLSDRAMHLCAGELDVHAMPCVQPENGLFLRGYHERLQLRRWRQPMHVYRPSFADLVVHAIMTTSAGQIEPPRRANLAWYSLAMGWRGPLFTFAALATACGTTGALPADAGRDAGDDGESTAPGIADASIETGAEAGAADAESDGASSDVAADGGFPCGDSLCDSSQICVHPPCGCVQRTEPLPESGVCPDASEYSDAAGACVVTAVCPAPYCSTPSSAMPLYCVDEGDGSLSGNVLAPPAGGSARNCYLACL